MLSQEKDFINIYPKRFQEQKKMEEQAITSESKWSDGHSTCPLLQCNYLCNAHNPVRKFTDASEGVEDQHELTKLVEERYNLNIFIPQFRILSEHEAYACISFLSHFEGTYII